MGFNNRCSQRTKASFDFPVTEPGPGDVLVRVDATPVNFPAIMASEKQAQVSPRETETTGGKPENSLVRSCSGERL
jgi:NADPH:quinone reductase-like Zn-dependent oxidoreductase